MSTEFLTGLFSNAWTIVLIVLFFGGSIFVHELGHFLAARWRGMKVTRFSIGFGPRIFGWKGRDGVEYRLSWLPLGGYVALPQLADMRAIEGEAEGAELEKLPPISYSTRMIVSVAGAAFNVIFAFLLACVIWVAGIPEPNDLRTTTIGSVLPAITLADDTRVPSPASQAGLQAGDIVKAVDGRPVRDWTALREALMMGSGRTDDGRPQVVFTLEREGIMRDVVLQPILGGPEGLRQVGITPVEDYDVVVGGLTAGGPGATAGLREGDIVAGADGTPVRSIGTLNSILAAKAGDPVALEIRRGTETVGISLPPRASTPGDNGLQVQFGAMGGYHYIYPNPFAQVWDQVVRTFRTLVSLVHPDTDIGLSKVSGPVGIVSIFYDAAAAGLRVVVWFTILININLAIFNLLPIPVLDGGHMLFATIGKLRGEPLPLNFVVITQNVFMALLLTMIIYVTTFDVRRLRRDAREDSAAPPAAAAPAAPAQDKK